MDPPGTLHRVLAGRQGPTPSSIQLLQDLRSESERRLAFSQKIFRLEFSHDNSIQVSAYPKGEGNAPFYRYDVGRKPEGPRER